MKQFTIFGFRPFSQIGRTMRKIRRHKLAHAADVKTKKGLAVWIRKRGYLDASASMEKVADEIGVSSAQLSYYFKTFIGKPFPTWRKEMRIQESLELLVKYPEMPIVRIGEHVGIPDKSNFKKQFREMMNLSPSEYRKNCGLTVDELPMADD